MLKLISGLAVSVLAVSACSRTVAVESTGDVPPPATTVSAPQDANSLPAGSTLQVRLNETIGTKESKVGDIFTATVDQAVMAEDGAVVIPAGAVVHGRVTGLDDSDHLGDAAAIRVAFDRITVNGRDYPFRARVTSADTRKQGDTDAETLKKAGTGAAAGLVLGAILGEGDVEKILAGAAIGAAAGTVISLGAGDVDAAIPAGSRLTLQASQTVWLR